MAKFAGLPRFNLASADAESTTSRQDVECVRYRAAFPMADSTRRPDKWETGTLGSNIRTDPYTAAIT